MSENGLRRILVVANRTCPCQTLQDKISEHASLSPSEVLIVAPALNKRLKHLTSDTDEAVMAAQQRLTIAVEGLLREGVEASGHVGDAHPGQAIEDALHEFPADELIIATIRPGDRTGSRRGCSSVPSESSTARSRTSSPTTGWTTSRQRKRLVSRP